MDIYFLIIMSPACLNLLHNEDNMILFLKCITKINFLRKKHGDLKVFFYRNFLCHLHFLQIDVFSI